MKTNKTIRFSESQISIIEKIAVAEKRQFSDMLRLLLENGIQNYCTNAFGNFHEDLQKEKNSGEIYSNTPHVRETQKL